VHESADSRLASREFGTQPPCAEELGEITPQSIRFWRLPCIRVRRFTVTGPPPPLRSRDLSRPSAARRVCRELVPRQIVRISVTMYLHTSARRFARVLS
jgi:hypothetical protein